MPRISRSGENELAAAAIRSTPQDNLRAQQVLSEIESGERPFPEAEIDRAAAALEAVTVAEGDGESTEFAQTELQTAIASLYQALEAKDSSTVDDGDSKVSDA